MLSPGAFVVPGNGSTWKEESCVNTSPCSRVRPGPRDHMRTKEPLLHDLNRYAPPARRVLPCIHQFPTKTSNQISRPQMTSHWPIAVHGNVASPPDHGRFEGLEAGSPVRPAPKRIRRSNAGIASNSSVPHSLAAGTAIIARTASFRDTWMTHGPETGGAIATR